MKDMTAKEFREIGLLQEVNRLFLHPRGLALEVIREADGAEHFAAVWRTDDPHGIAFAEGEEIDAAMVGRVQQMFDERVAGRRVELGTPDGIQAP